MNCGFYELKCGDLLFFAPVGVDLLAVGTGYIGADPYIVGLLGCEALDGLRCGRIGCDELGVIS